MDKYKLFSYFFVGLSYCFSIFSSFLLVMFGYGVTKTYYGLLNDNYELAFVFLLLFAVSNLFRGLSLTLSVYLDKKKDRLK